MVTFNETDSKIIIQLNSQKSFILLKFVLDSDVILLLFMSLDAKKKKEREKEI